MAGLLQALLRNESGGRNIANVHQGTSSGQAQGYFQITTGTWKDFGGQKYAPTPLQASYRQQAEIASKIPLKRWDESTVAMMRRTGKRIDPDRTLGENLAAHGESFNQGSTKPMKFPFRLTGGGLRPDAVSGFQQPFHQALVSMFQSAPPEVQRELAIASGYRSYKVQQALWNASDKTGRTVARPGSSKHEHGTAADLFGFGLGGKHASSVSQKTKDWVHQNAGQFGLYFPMNYEPWHIQLQNTAGLRHVGGAGSGATNFGQDAQPVTGEAGGGGTSSAPGGIAGLIGDELTGEDKDKPLSGLLGDLLKPEQPQLLQSNLSPPPQQASGVQSLPEYIQQFMAMRMRGQPQPPSGGAPGSGGQGIG